ncbi:hypothetical protein RHP06_25885, partial [Salmonella enterica subsp. enterica serovar Typhimurium]|nr:hypothetical protein [Salmonella enterica subsp. enterica serovar Typhimurium]
MHSNTNQPPRLKRFFEDNEQLTTELSKNALIAKEAFLQAAEWFGERQNNPTPDVFFGIFHRFTENYKKALEEVSKRRTQSLLLNKLPAEETPKA